MPRVMLKRRQQPRAIPDGYQLLLEESISPPYPPGWTMKLYDMGVPNQLFVRYPDCSQIHSLAWHRDRLRAAGVDFAHLEPVVVPPPVKAKQVKELCSTCHDVGTVDLGPCPECQPKPVQRVKLRLR